MKKLAVISGGCLLAFIVLMAGAGFWIKGHMGEITRRLTGMEMRFSSLGLSYFPMPTIVMANLSVKAGNNSVSVPTVRLYPDLGKILSGQIQFKKAVFEKPLFVVGSLDATSAGATGGTAAQGAPLSTDRIPTKIVMLNQARLVLKAARGDTVLPVSLTAKAEKVGQGLFVQLKNASIDEIGLKFVGDMRIESFAPLRLKVDATQGTFNPTAVKDFLLKFGYLSDQAAAQIPTIRNMDCSGLQFTFDAGSGDLELAADNLNLDKIQFHKLGVKLSDGGTFAVRCSEGTVDAGSVFNWLQQNPQGEKVLQNALSSAKLKTLIPEGNIRLSSLQFSGRRRGAEDPAGALAVDGSLQTKIQGLVLHLVAENGEKQNLTIGQLDATVTLQQGKPTVRIDSLNFNSSKGGNGSITGLIPIPLDLKRMSLRTAIDSLNIFDTTVNLHLAKAGRPKAAFDLSLTSPSFKLAADGVAFIPASKQTDLDLKLRELHIAGPASDAPSPPSKAEPAIDRHFDLSAIQGRKVSAVTFIKHCWLGDLTKLNDVNLQFKSGNDRALLNATMRISGINLGVTAVALPPDRLVTTIETRGTDVDLTSLIACFSTELPVFLSGRLYLVGSFSTQGNSVQSMINAAQGSVTVTVIRASVRRLSSLDPRLGFLLDILRAAHLNSDSADSISFSRGVVSANLKDGRIIIDSFSLIGPLLRTWGSGEFTIKKQHLKLTGSLKTALGVSTAYNIDRFLKREKNDGSSTS